MALQVEIVAQFRPILEFSRSCLQRHSFFISVFSVGCGVGRVLSENSAVS